MGSFSAGHFEPGYPSSGVGLLLKISQEPLVYI